MKRSPIPIILWTFLLASCAGVSAHAPSGEPAFIIITRNPDDRVKLQYENGTTLIDIQSPTGIGSATFELEAGSMPAEMILRLHLKGLEQLRLTSAQDSIAASLPGGDASSLDHQTILASGIETPIRPGHPLWMEIRIEADQPEQKIPLEEGYFEVTLPREFIQNAGQRFEIEWIDFYR